jgi:hypothetical protein
MTSDNKYSLDQNKQAALAAGQLPHKQMGAMNKLRSVGNGEAFEGISARSASTRSKISEKG